MVREFYDAERSKKFASCPGSPMKDVYHGEVQADGTIKLVFDRTVNFQEFIDSFEEETDIMNQLARVNAGEVNLLSVNHGEYFDATQFPRDYRSVLQTVIDGENYFNSLDPEIKEKFDFDFNKWFATIDTEEWYKKMNPVSSAPEVVIKEEVKTE